MFSCEKDNLNESGIILPELQVETTEVNPLVNRTKKSNDQSGLDLGCFTINYPFSLVAEDGSVVSIESDSDFDDLVEVELFIDFEYPLSITNSDGEVQDVNNEEDLSNAFATCVPLDEWGEGFPAYNIGYDNSCFTIIYPITVVDLEGDEIEVNSESEFNSLISTDIHFFDFPISIEDLDGNLKEIDSEDDLFNELFSCNDWIYADSLDVQFGGVVEVFTCLNIQFPVNIETGKGDIKEVNSDEELNEFIFKGDFTDFAYPVEFIDEEGNILVAEDAEGLDIIIESCFDGFVFDFEIDLWSLLALSNQAEIPETTCYDLSFPIQGYSDISEETITVNSPSEILALTEFYEVVFPFNIVLSSDGSTVSIEDQDTFFSILEECN